VRRDLRRRLLQPRDRARRQHQIGAGLGELLRDHAPEPGATAGDERCLSCQQIGAEDFDWRRRSLHEQLMAYGLWHMVLSPRHNPTYDMP
jgi:hypothetical protein